MDLLSNIIGPFFITSATLEHLDLLIRREAICSFASWPGHVGHELTRLHIPSGCAIDCDYDAPTVRISLPSGDVLVLRHRDVDPAGPWALSVELAEHALHRETMAALHASFAAGEAALEQRHRAAVCVGCRGRGVVACVRDVRFIGTCGQCAGQGRRNDSAIIHAEN